MVVIKKTELTLFKLLHIALTDSRDYLIPEDVNWTELFQLACNQGVVALVCDGLQEIADAGVKISALTDSVHGKRLKLSLIGQAMAVKETGERQMDSAKQLSKLWAKNGIRTLVLKGMAFGSYYPIPNHRFCVDMDCYLTWFKVQGSRFKKEDNVVGAWELGNSLIERQGIEVKKEDYRHSTFFFGDLHVENHKICTTVRGRKQRKVFEKYLRGLLENEPTTRIADSNLEVPCPMFNALYFLQHAHRHFLRECVTLRHICDWAMITDKCKDKINWDEFRTIAEQNDLLSFAESMTRLAKVVCGVKCDALIKEYAMQPQDRMLLDDCYAISDNVIKYGNDFKAHLQMVKNLINQRWKHKYFSKYSFITEILTSVWGVFFEKNPEID